MSLADKPTRPFLGGLYGVTKDGYVIATKRRGTTVYGIALTPTEKDGRIIYRITADRKTTTYSMSRVVLDAWGDEQCAVMPVNVMRSAVRAHNSAVRNAYRVDDAEEKAPQQGICPYCTTRPIRKHPCAHTCGEPPCVLAHKLAVERLRKKRIAAERRAMGTQPPPKPVVIDTMPCPWASKQLTTPPAPGYGWHTAEADPMSAGWAADGLWFVVRETETERERRAA